MASVFNCRLVAFKIFEFFVLYICMVNVVKQLFTKVVIAL